MALVNYENDYRITHLWKVMNFLSTSSSYKLSLYNLDPFHRCGRLSSVCLNLFIKLINTLVNPLGIPWMQSQLESEVKNLNWAKKLFRRFSVLPRNLPYLGRPLTLRRNLSFEHYVKAVKKKNIMHDDCEFCFPLLLRALVQSIE